MESTGAGPILGDFCAETWRMRVRSAAEFGSSKVFIAILPILAMSIFLVAAGHPANHVGKDSWIGPTDM
ncbi:MAG: hypothetical protein ACKO0V_10885, partial [bacterium]